MFVHNKWNDSTDFRPACYRERERTHPAKQAILIRDRSILSILNPVVDVINVFLDEISISP